MIKSYKFVTTVHSKLNDYVIAFFHKIENDRGGFRDELFEAEFLPIVQRHQKILKNRFRTIYEYVSTLPEIDRKSFCQRIIESNEIEKICCGEYKPEVFGKNLSGVHGILKDLFDDLYNQVLDGNPFREIARTTLREHFNQFCDANGDITICPICGIGELKKSQDETRDQYDHYLPKSLYPLSSINFHNLVPCCKECNSFDVKGNKDIIAVSTGKLFFPYDINHKGISLIVKVKQDDPEIDKIQWELLFSSPDNRNDEIESWRIIYSIDNRYYGYIKARVIKWYKHYYNYFKSLKLSHCNSSQIKEYYMLFLDEDENLGLSFIRKPTLDSLLSGSNIVQAAMEALEYS